MKGAKQRANAYKKAAQRELLLELRQRAEQGNPVAQYDLGVNYEEGKNVERDYEKALYWYEKAAKQAYTPAQTALGFCYSSLNGSIEVAQDSERALYWFRKAAEQGDAIAQYFLAICYCIGEGGKKTKKKLFFGMKKPQNKDTYKHNMN